MDGVVGTGEFVTRQSVATTLVDVSEMSVAYELGTFGGDPAVEFRVTVNGDVGYAALGFRGASEDYDVVAWEPSLDNVGDYHEGSGHTALDMEQDVMFASRTGRTFVFYRKLKTGDHDDCDLHVGEPFTLAWAVGEGTPRDGAWSFHGGSGHREVTLQAFDAQSAPNPPAMTDFSATGASYSGGYGSSAAQDPGRSRRSGHSRR